MTDQDRATLGYLESILARAKARYDMYRTVALQDRVKRIEESIQFIKGETK
jgi:hypothetical protein